MMKAVRIHNYGGPEELCYEDAPIPDPRPGEILICVHAAGVNPADRQIRAGLRHRHERPFSLILGGDLSGVIEKVGLGVVDLGVGDEVYGRLVAMGGYAQYAAGPTASFARKPQSLDHVHAAALPIVALTAWQALFEVGGLSAGQKVLIHAAAGGVGHIAVQFAKWQNAYVLGTASARNEAFLRGIGVDEFIDYQATAFESVAHDIDLVLDAIPREVDDRTDALARDTIERSWGVLKDGGVLVSICTRPVPKAAAAARGVRGIKADAQSRRDLLEQIARLADEGYVKSVVNTVLPLREARRAHKLIQTGHTQGKIVLRVRD
jgi:NADPH:quinone reductase-like Zn-dependent oxidoreductase